MIRVVLPHYSVEDFASASEAVKTISARYGHFFCANTPKFDITVSHVIESLEKVGFAYVGYGFSSISFTKQEG